MMGKTHIAVGIASAMAVMQPKTATELIAATVGGAIGGIMSDIDVRIDRSSKHAKKTTMDALYGEVMVIMLTIFLLAADFTKGRVIVDQILSSGQRGVIGAGAFLLLTAIGEVSKHRGKTHSLIGCMLFTGAVMLIHQQIALAFGVGFLSHLLIDLLNKAPIQLFWPLKKSFCLKWCYADQLANELFLIGGFGVMIYFIFGVML